MDRSNHYEAAFEAYLRDARFAYIAIDESKRTSFDDLPIKSLDFIVYGKHESRLLVDVKGRKVGGPKRGVSWQNWATREDIDGLTRWAERFGSDYRGLLAFTYRIDPTLDLPAETPDLWVWQGERYLIRAIDVSEYARRMRTRSEKWGTVHLPTADFRACVRPFRAFAVPEPEEVA